MVTFDPTRGPPGGVGRPPTDALTGILTGLPSGIPTDVPSNAPTIAPLGLVRYEITGHASIAVYSNGLAGEREVDNPALPDRETIDGGYGTGQDRKTAYGKHAKVQCEWDPPLSIQSPSTR